MGEGHSIAVKLADGHRLQVITSEVGVRDAGRSRGRHDRRRRLELPHWQVARACSREHRLSRRSSMPPSASPFDRGPDHAGHVEGAAYRIESGSRPGTSRTLNHLT